MKKWLFLLYSIICYLIFFGTIVYFIGFVQNFFFHKTIDSTSISLPVWSALTINFGLLILFGFQHSTMARKGFKQVWVRIIPPPIERSTYVLVSSITLIIFMTGWQPLTSKIWDLTEQGAGVILTGLSWVGWALALTSSFSINHFHLFGIFQTYMLLKGQIGQSSKFKMPFLYKLVRHPLYLGFLIAFWSTPLMTQGRFLFAMVMTIYVLIAITMEERDLVEEFGDDYEKYKEKVPKIFPVKPPFRKK